MNENQGSGTNGGSYTLKKLRNRPEFSKRAAQWFSEKWKIPSAAYEESINYCIRGDKAVPQWYVVLDEKGKIVAGAGVIKNDFHNRKDLSPNLCALFVEKEHRRQGIALRLLNEVRQDLKSMGVWRLYLVTDHTNFYEKCGWEFLTMVQDEEGRPERMYTAFTR